MAAELRLWIDEQCALCRRFGQWLQRRAQHRAVELHLLPLPPDADAVRLSIAGRTLSGEAAVLEVLHQLGGIWRWGARLLRWVPRPLRRLGYRVVARTRYCWQGERCRI
jgi:predicted DCC family thiol-disulfide oxidoreductase YuxK